MRDDVFVANNASTNFSFIFSLEAEDYVSFEIEDFSTYGTFMKSIQYAEISKANYEEYGVDEIEAEFDVTYIATIKENITAQFEEWIEILNDATALVSAYVNDDLAGLNPDGSFLSNLVDNEAFPGLTHQDLLDYYIAQHMLVISDQQEFSALCTGCSFSGRTFEGLLDEAQDAYDNVKDEPAYIDLLEFYGDFSRLTYQESTNRIMYEYYGHRFNNQFYQSSRDEFYSLELVSSFEREFGSILSLVFLVVPRFVLDIIPFLDRIVTMIENLESNPGFIRFMESTNLDLLISSISTNAIRSLVMVVLYTVVYIILVISVGFLSIVLINLYGNIYETATRKRIKELASLRVLGTSYDDIHDMVKIENKRVAIFSYLCFILILFALGQLDLFTDAPINHFYMPLLGLFFDFNLYDVFLMNYVVIITVTIIFYFFIYRFIIRRVSTKKLLNIDTIKAIRDGDNL